MNEYETIVVTQPNITESDNTKISSKLSSLIERGSGRLFYAKDMGKKTLAYPIKKQTKAVYTCFDYAGAGDVVQDFERALRIDENVLRFLTVVKNTSVDIEARAAEIVAKGEDVSPVVEETAVAPIVKALDEGDSSDGDSNDDAEKEE